MNIWTLPAFSLLLLLAACQDNSYGSKESAALSDSLSVTGLTGDDVKLVRTADLELKVRDVAEGAQAVAALSRAHGGAVFHQAVAYPQTEQRTLRHSADSLTEVHVVRPEARLTVRVPQQQLDSFLLQAAAIGYHTYSSTLNTEDRSLQHLGHTLQAEVREEALETPVVPRAPEAVAARGQSVSLQEEVIRHRIASMEIDAAAAYSSVELHLSQNPLVQREIVADTGIDALELPFSSRWSDAVSDGVRLFGEALLLLTHLWPFALIAGLLLSGHRLYKRAGWRIFR